MRILLYVCMLALLGLVSVPAYAGCFGSPNFYTCNDASGNNYTVNRFGNMTTMQGSNPYTGSQWNQTTNRLGNMAITNGMTNGRSWNETQTYLGGGNSAVNGMDSRGQFYSYTCNQYGCR